MKWSVCNISHIRSLSVCVCVLWVHRSEVMEQLIQSSDLFVMQVEMDVYTALKKVNTLQTSRLYFSSQTQTHCKNIGSAVDVPAAQPVVGRSNQTAPRRRWRLALQTKDRYWNGTFTSLFFFFKISLQMFGSCCGWTHRSVWEGAVSEHRGRSVLQFRLQTRSSPVHHQWSGVCTKPGAGQYSTSWWEPGIYLNIFINITDGIRKTSSI